MRVLIAEDTESVRFALRLAVEALGHEVVALATNGEEAIARYLETKPECVLMDVRMPHMDGLTCARKLITCDPQVKIIIVTGGRTTRREATAAGAYAFIEKPFDLTDLGNTIVALA